MCLVGEKFARLVMEEVSGFGSVLKNVVAWEDFSRLLFVFDCLVSDIVSGFLFLFCGCFKSFCLVAEKMWQCA